MFIGGGQPVGNPESLQDIEQGKRNSDDINPGMQNILSRYKRLLPTNRH